MICFCRNPSGNLIKIINQKIGSNTTLVCPNLILSKFDFAVFFFENLSYVIMQMVDHSHTFSARSLTKKLSTSVEKNSIKKRKILDEKVHILLKVYFL